MIDCSFCLKLTCFLILITLCVVGPSVVSAAFIEDDKEEVNIIEKVTTIHVIFDGYGYNDLTDVTNNKLIDGDGIEYNLTANQANWLRWYYNDHGDDLNQKFFILGVNDEIRYIDDDINRNTWVFFK